MYVDFWVWLVTVVAVMAGAHWHGFKLGFGDGYKAGHLKGYERGSRQGLQEPEIEGKP